MDNRRKILNLVGLATKAGKIGSGEFTTEKSVKTGKAKLVLVSEEASNNTRKMFDNMCTYYKVPIYFFGTKGELGHAMGKEMRASLAVMDDGFAKAIVKLMNGSVDRGQEDTTVSAGVCMETGAEWRKA